MMHFSYKTQGTCCKQIDLIMNGYVISDVIFTGGCPGNLMAIRQLIKGMHADRVIELLQDVQCGSKPNSCAMQLCEALKQYKGVC